MWKSNLRLNPSKNFIITIYDEKMADLSNIINPNSPHAQNIQRILRPTPPKKVDPSQIKSTSSNSKMAVAEPRIVRKLLPIAAFLVTFVTVMTMLLLYMDTTAIRHHQFQINMTQDYDLMGVEQDNEQLITYIREVHVRPAIEPRLMMANTINDRFDIEPTEKERKVAELLNYKKYGTFLETGAYKHGRISDTEWLERNLSWTGLLQQTYPRDFFDLLKKGRTNSKAIHACLSTQPHPKEITIPPEGRDGVKINSIHANSVTSDESDWFNTRIKCFPLYSLMLAMNLTSLDFLNVDADCTEFEVLKTVPLERLKVEVIAVRLLQDCPTIEPQPTDKTLKWYLASYNYKFVQKLNDDYIFILNHVKI